MFLLATILSPIESVVLMRFVNFHTDAFLIDSNFFRSSSCTEYFSNRYCAIKFLYSVFVSCLFSKIYSLLRKFELMKQSLQFLQSTRKWESIQLCDLNKNVDL